MRAPTHRDFAPAFGLTIVPVADLTVEKTADGWVDSLTQKPLSKRRAEQLDALVLPPAWQDVRASPLEEAHLQAIGVDEAGRTQYRYHEAWPDVRNAVKGERLLAFGRSLPAIRQGVKRDLGRDKLSKRAVAATAVRLIDRELVRPGNEAYARNGTTGASTLKPGHVQSDGSQMRYRGKSGVKIELTITDKALRRRLAGLKRSNRKRLFRYRSENAASGKAKRSLLSQDINAYLRKRGGRPVSAKDFRTFAASAMALETFCQSLDVEVGKRSRVVSSTMKDVAKELRNTAAVARSSYVHPAVVEAYEADRLEEGLIKGRLREGLDRKETALMRFLEQSRPSTD